MAALPAARLTVHEETGHCPNWERPERVAADIAAAERIVASPFPVEIIGLSAEKLTVPDNSFESIVSTFTLCTIPDVRGALLEVRRALALRLPTFSTPSAI
jgi:hypothetical protein